jgi:hypothetical protein
MLLLDFARREEETDHEAKGRRARVSLRREFGWEPECVLRGRGENESSTVDCSSYGGLLDDLYRIDEGETSETSK